MDILQEYSLGIPSKGRGEIKQTGLKTNLLSEEIDLTIQIDK